MSMSRRTLNSLTPEMQQKYLEQKAKIANRITPETIIQPKIENTLESKSAVISLIYKGLAMPMDYSRRPRFQKRIEQNKNINEFVSKNMLTYLESFMGNFDIKFRALVSYGSEYTFVKSDKDITESTITLEKEQIIEPNIDTNIPNVEINQESTLVPEQNLSSEPMLQQESCN